MQSVAMDRNILAVEFVRGLLLSGMVFSVVASINGAIADNLRIHDNTGKPVVVVNSPRGWEKPEQPVQRNNRNHMSDRAP